MLGICRFAGKRVLEQVLTTFVRKTESGNFLIFVLRIAGRAFIKHYLSFSGLLIL